jgi:hypothetical protein
MDTSARDTAVAMDTSARDTAVAMDTSARDTAVAAPTVPPADPTRLPQTDEDRNALLAEAAALKKQARTEGAHFTAKANHSVEVRWNHLRELAASELFNFATEGWVHEVGRVVPESAVCGPLALCTVLSPPQRAECGRSRLLRRVGGLRKCHPKSV